MKILMLPNNIACRMNQNIAILRRMGHEADGILISPESDISDTDHISIYRAFSHKDKSLKALIATVPTFLKVFKAIYKADIVHWYFGSSSVFVSPFLWWIKFLNKPAVVEFCGSDIRVFEEAVKDNPYLKESDLSAFFKTKEKSLFIQQRFKNHNFNAMTFGYELEDYIDSEIYPQIYKTNRCINIDQIEPIYSKNIKIPIITHIPSKSFIKGTEHILQIIKRLKGKGLKFEFIQIENVLHSQVINIFKKSDIIIDQLLIGDHGTTTLEAMALGKTTICYLKPSIAAKMPDDCPIINASVDTLENVLERLIINPKEIEAVGYKSRKYMEQYHDAKLIVKELVVTYEKFLPKARGT